MSDFLQVIPRVLFSTDRASATSNDCDCADCDCACSLPSLPTGTSHRPSTSTVIKHNFNLHIQRLAPGYDLVFGPYCKPTVLNSAGRLVFSFFEHPRGLSQLPAEWTGAWGKALVDETVEQLIASGLLIQENQGPPVLQESNTVLSAWLHVTDRCNLRCRYCYLPHVRQDMSLEVGMASIDAIFRSAMLHQCHEVKLKYAGGEALLCFSIVSQLHEYAAKLSSQTGIDLRGVVLTNGTLLKQDVVDCMKRLQLKLMVSLDGFGDTHDAQRPYISGVGTFTQVVRGVILAHESGLVPDISITVTKQSVGGLPELIDWVLDKDLPFSLNFYRENELSATFEDLQLEEDVIVQGMCLAYKRIEARLPRRSLLASLVDRANLSAPHIRTCGVGHNYLVFDYQGRVGKCQMQLKHPVTTIHAADPLSVINAAMDGIQNLSVEEKEGCRSCEWKYWCTGGCALTTYRATGRYDVKSPNCRIYKALYPEAMRLEGLRLLKYAEQFQ